MNLKKPKLFETTFAAFTATEIVGQGGSGSVYKAIDDAGTVVAVKLLDPLLVSKLAQPIPFWTG